MAPVLSPTAAPPGRARPPRPDLRRRLAPLASCIGASLVVVALTAAAVAAQAPPAAPNPATSAAAPNPLLPSPPPAIAPELAGIPLRGDSYDAAKQARDRAQAALDDTTRVKHDSLAAILRLTLQRRDVGAKVIEDSTSVQSVSRELTSLRQRIRSVALGSYVEGQGVGDTSYTSLDLDIGSATREGTSQTTMRAARLQLLGKERQAAADLAETQKAVTDRSADLRAIDADLAAATERHDRAAGAELGLAIDLLGKTQDLQGVRGLSSVVGVDFPLVVLDSYWKAAQSQQACGIQWWALAGIGQTESAHGTDGGSKVAANGDTSKPIVGIALDGSAGTASIPDTDHGLFDGDPLHDRAVGPMQFIPSTWMSWARDGNGDGRPDPNNFYDAAMGAAAYLCASGPMRTDADLIRGFLSYNHDPYYAALVLQRAKTYGVALKQLGTAPTSPPAATLPPPPASGTVTKGAAGAPPTAPPTTVPKPGVSTTTSPAPPAPAPPQPTSPSTTAPPISISPPTTSPPSTAPPTSAPTAAPASGG